MKIRNILKDTFYYKIIMIIGMVLCALWIIFINSAPFSDFDYYYKMAVTIANGGSWGDTYTSVGYSIVLGGIFKLFGASVIKAKIFNIILTFISYLLFKSILFKLDLNDIDRRILFALFVFIPNNIFYNSILGTELLFTVVLLIITNFYMSEVKFKYFWIGILSGINTMIKPFFIIIFFAIFLVEIIMNKKIIGSIKNALIVLVVTVIVISPWIYRNSKLMGEFTYVSNNGGIVLYINNNSQNSKGRWMAASSVENSIVNTSEYKNENMTGKNKMLSTSAKEWIKSHPAKFIELGFKRLFNTYFVGDDIIYSTYASGISNGFRYFLIAYANLIREIVFAPAILCIIVYSIFILKCLIKRRSYLISKFNIYGVLLFFMFTCVYFVTEGQGRYSFPIIFVLLYYFYMFFKNLFLFGKIRKN
ncbi:hypothetical protein GTH52_03805 [Clostridium tyrobutyricum]|uniref:Transporter n=1 Tax=Clostridium tyrobutyricum DIVETGP TaxID=1408889 RepID=W6N2Z2_CLOTY|nr:hypothetical protein [Clostridium tyrobutyricum]AND85016.1 hypothetical protein CTK_C17610 [Clostridium tyrobutyricum]ANP69579.1 hypothetical protein BA182_07820 [Clostridium tyrobutyricum]MBV4433068.1 hypothetical protein [Clostridium tyrobutyricum]MBV4449337.1 hypothetical protein [Clostridium tyrobutyricum]QNB66060.1 hypothetical protein GTH52_03805 [Clostridium tyrobutyricum]